MTFTDTNILIDTGLSKLIISTFTQENLLKKCVEEVQHTVIHHPQIMIMGKTANQQRDVGFYSDESS